MIRVKLDQFCNLATSPAWQAWLFHYSRPLYDGLVDKLRSSHGCGHNREIMEGVLQQITNNGGSTQLEQFLRQHYPHSLEEPIVKPAAIKTIDNPDKFNIFPHYDPQLLTFPRRLIMVGEKEILLKYINEFVVDKAKVEYMILSDRLYIEYLPKDSQELVNKIPIKNWFIPVYRKNNNI